MTHFLMSRRPFSSLFLVCLLGLLSGCGGESAAPMPEDEGVEQTVTVDTTADLLAFYPKFKRVDLVFGSMPSTNEESVLFCCSAAFTEKELKQFNHMNIAGNHVGGGEFHKGYACAKNTGGFVFYDNRWQFFAGDFGSELGRAADKRGMGFGQMLIIHDGRRMAAHVGGRYVFRALCEHEGRLCIIESRRLQDFEYFVHALQAYGVSEALYLVMGAGWNHSWYRDMGGGARILHPHRHDFSTNWLVFYR